jgi:hypothetical protein
VTAAADGLHAAGLALEEDIRKMDAGELHATPEQRAFLMGAKNAFLGQRTTESGGYPVDPPGPGATDVAETAQIQGMDGGRPENTGLAGAKLASIDGGAGRAATGSRPTAASAGAGGMFYDTTLGKPIWSDGTTWKDATGTVV